MARLLLVILIILCSVTAQAQKSIFEETFDGCGAHDTCIYCGDKPAYYEKNLVSFFSWKLEHAGHGYNVRGGNIYFEVAIDSTGQSCVTAVHNRYMDYDLKNDMRRWINNEMPDWKRAMKNNHPINSTVIISFEMRANWLGINCVMPDQVKR